MATPTDTLMDHIHTIEAAKAEYHGHGTSGFMASKSSRYLILSPEKGGIWYLLGYAVLGDIHSFDRFVETNNEYEYHDSELTAAVPGSEDHRWIILVSIVVRKIIAFFAKPLEWTGYFVDFLLNLLHRNGNLLGLLYNLMHGKVVVPHRGTETFLSTIGLPDHRIDLYTGQVLAEANVWEVISKPEMGNRASMDLCMMAFKLAYENAKVIKSIVKDHWKMHFVDFQNCWNALGGTGPFDADDWSTDFDYSWCEIPKMGKVHMGFIEALGLGNIADPATFYFHLQGKNRKLSSSTDVNIGGYSSRGKTESVFPGIDSNVNETDKTAYYVVRSILKSLLEKHKNAYFIVTGHSLGGALAIMLPTVLVLHEEMEMMERLLGVYTFGQPRIGNRQLGRFMEAHLGHPVRKYFRMVYCNDLVPRLPYDDNIFLYKHFGVCLCYNSLYIEQVECKEGWFRILFRVIGLALPGVSAHCSTDYVNSKTWNGELHSNVLFPRP